MEYPNAIEKELLKGFGHQPTPGQMEFLRRFSGFVAYPGPGGVFVLKGYAGTGKTALMKTLATVLPKHKRKVVLLAPTGRAAKILAQRTGKQAFTLHKALYTPQISGGRVEFTLRENKSSYAVFVVDEASMIGEGQGADPAFASRNLLADLLEFVARGVGCKLLLVGDPAQLPPVGTELSPALDPAALEAYSGEKPEVTELTEVVRQARDSGILLNATALRQLQGEPPYPPPQLLPGPDVIRLTDGWEIEDALQTAYGRYGRESVAFVVRSNKRANQYNRQIRSRILGQENEVATGDRLMVVRNNYFWLGQKSKAGFIANGEIVEVMSLGKTLHLHDLRFAEATVRLVDYPEQEPFDCQILLNTLDHEGPSLDYETMKRFYDSVRQDYASLSRYRQMEAVRKDPYFNALQVKFAYAVTCHKAQGGQWEQVFVEQAWLPNGQVDLDYLRWLYTAFTRAVSRLYLIGFPETYFRS